MSDHRRWYLVVNGHALNKEFPLNAEFIVQEFLFQTRHTIGTIEIKQYSMKELKAMENDEGTS